MTTFKDIGLNDHIQQSLEELGYINPTPIQEQAIPFVLENDQDLIGLAQTGTGKTAAFGLPILHKLEKNKDVQAIILCPTRELCLQISKEMAGFAKYSKGVGIATIYGGARADLQVQQIRAGANIVVGTPGRVHDMIRRKVLKMHTIRFVVLDEADEMLDMGFKDDLDAILADTPETKQTLLFSATMSPVIRNIAKNFMHDPQEISVGKKNIGADKVVHQYYLVKQGQKYEALRRIVDSEPDIYGILFCRTRNETQEIADKLKEDHYSTEALHGEISQNLRTQIMDRFRQRKIQLLVATDVAARGIDVNDLTHIINYNLPDVNEVYVHRSGRTGRAQKSGISISILTNREFHKVRELESKTGKTFEQKQVPTGQEICEKQLISLVEKMKEIKVNDKEIAPFMPVVEEMLGDFSREELLARFVSAEFNHFLTLYKDKQDLTAVPMGRESFSGRINDRGERRERGERQPEENFVNVHLNIGRRDNLEVKTLLGFINSQPELKGAEIGKVKISEAFTVFGIDKNRAGVVTDSFKSARYNGRALEARVLGGGGVERPGRSSYGEKSFADKRRDSKSPRYEDKKAGKAKGRRK